MFKKKIKETPEIYNVLSLAERLHKTVAEILQMTTYEFMLWLSYFELKNDENERQQRIAKMKHGR